MQVIIYIVIFNLYNYQRFEFLLNAYETQKIYHYHMVKILVASNTLDQEVSRGSDCVITLFCLTQVIILCKYEVYVLFVDTETSFVD